ncbi:ATP-dependent helicase [Segetibacter sp. 3557_3]|uniref:UvrD-helicase domain-containing protein n=1 Tax=Segetibacter sp. 3557_3 TaxID=2547429 RepID=UPI00105891AF|nr:UvrD-helicase domain-containing protein [Segetibacter sp. 3557_3]TDH26777.1 ATP-dependent helicase [Segetibacter sp. 3557_3]
MNKQQLTDFFCKEQLTLEVIILEAAKKFLADHESLPNFFYDLRCAQEEAYNLVKNEDLCYDRYTTPFAYTLWYQARRINIFLSNFIDKVVEACQSNVPITIFDLGAGTGCIQFCFAIAAAACERMGYILPMFRIVNVDLSPFMLNYLQKYLWPEVIKKYPEVKGVAVEYHVYSWSNKAELSIINPWVCASYLFDSSDNEDYLQTNFSELITAFNPSKVLLLTSSQLHKEQLMQKLSTNMKGVGYRILARPSSSLLFQGNLQSVSDFRNTLVNKYGLKASLYPVSWQDRSFTTIGLEKFQTGLSFNLQRYPDHFNLFNPPLKIRRQVALNEDQRKASLFEVRPSMITGPAGCGKSVVITEKIINLLEERKWTGPIAILVTTFNKSLLRQLRAWISDLLNQKDKNYKQVYYSVSNNMDDGTGKIIINNQQDFFIEFLHFEMLAKHIGNIKYLPFEEATHVRKLEEIIKEVRIEMSIPESKMKNILTPEFLLEEYHRVIYGLQCRINLGEGAYLAVSREGRGKGLRGSTQRPAVWQALKKYAVWMARDPKAGQSYSARRQLLYNFLEKGEIVKKHDYLFVDEFQDCTRTDFEIMNMLLSEAKNIVLAGDLAQSVHIGKSGFIPKDAERGNWKRHQLRGSYRLPFRICEAIYPLSSQINKASIHKEATAEITPYKGAPPGARPLFVYAGDNIQLAKKLSQIRAQYSVFDLNRITIMEKDDNLCKEIRGLGIIGETTTILRLKGLEKEFIVWSLQADIEYEDEVMEFAYTIMTRTNCLLVIASTPEAKDVHFPVLKYLRRDRLIMWDIESERNFGMLLDKQVVAEGIDD